MEEQIKSLDENLVIYKREDFDNEIHVYCKRNDNRKYIHQTTIREVKDIPFNGKKVKIFLSVRRFKNQSDSKSQKDTITEQFAFLNDTKRRTKRLEERLYELTKNQNFTSAAKYANKYIADICDDTLINMVLKKMKM